MKELLDLTRREYEAAQWYMDEDSSCVVNVEKDVRLPAFERFMNLHNFVQQTQMEIKDRCIFIGFALLEIKRDKLYCYVAPKDKGGCGYSSFKKFCKEVFGLPESTSAKMVRVAEQFCEDDGNVKLGFHRFSYSQLAEMLSIEPAHRVRIGANLSCRDIRHLGELYKTYPPKEETSVEADLARWREIHAEEQAKKNAKKNSLTFIPAQQTKNEGSTSNPDINALEEDEFDGEDHRDLSTPEQHISFEAIRNGLLRQLQLLRDCDVGVAWMKCADIFEEALNTNTPRRVANSKEVAQANIEVARLKEKLNTPHHEGNAAEIYIHKDMPEVLIRDAIRRGFELLRVKLPSLNHAFCDIVAEELDSGHMQVYSTEAYDLLFRSNYELQRELEELKTQSGPIVREGMALPSAQKLTLKNAKERKEWLEGYESWPVWLEVPEVSKTFYRYDFLNGAALIIEVGVDFWQDWQRNTRSRIRKKTVHYAIIDEEYPEYDSAYQGGASGIIDWLTKHSKEI